MTRPAQRPVETVRPLPRDSGPLRLYAGALRHLAGRTAVLLSTAALRLGRWATARDRAVEAAAAAQARAAGHPSARPRLAVVPGGYAQGRADLQFTPLPAHLQPAHHSPFACLGTDCADHPREDR